jgi:hypothetical protein
VKSVGGGARVLNITRPKKRVENAVLKRTALFINGFKN